MVGGDVNRERKSADEAAVVVHPYRLDALGGTHVEELPTRAQWVTTFAKTARIHTLLSWGDLLVEDDEFSDGSRNSATLGY